MTARHQFPSSWRSWNCSTFFSLVLYYYVFKVNNVKLFLEVPITSRKLGCYTRYISAAACSIPGTRTVNPGINGLLVVYDMMIYSKPKVKAFYFNVHAAVQWHLYAGWVARAEMLPAIPSYVISPHQSQFIENYDQVNHFYKIL